MKGSSLLKVCGILMIIGAAFGILGIVVALGGTALLGAAAGSVGGGIAIGVIFLIGTIIRTVIQLIAGIFGIKYNADPAKARLCIIMGIVIIVLGLISVFASWGGQDTYTNIIGLVGSLLIPGLYTYAAFQVKSQG